MSTYRQYLTTLRRVPDDIVWRDIYYVINQNVPRYA